MALLKKHKHDLLLIIGILLHTLILFHICGFDRTISTNDEMSYYEGARSIFHGRGVQIHSLDLNLKNLAYVFFLVPFFYIRNTIERIKVITFVQAFLFSSCAIPVWLIGKEFKLGTAYRWATVLIFFCWPDNLTVCTLASENLYWPLCAWSFYLWIKALNSRSWRLAIGCAFVHFLTYFCKEVAICLPLAYVGYTLVFPIIEMLTVGCQNKGKKLYTKEDWKFLLIYLGTYIFCYTVVNHVFLAGIENLYNSKMNLAFLHNRYAVIYCFYGMIYYLVAVTTAFLVVPVLYPGLSYKNMRVSLRRAYCYCMVLFLGMVFVIAVTITVKEDIGMLIPRVHMRYLAPMICILLPVFFGLIEEKQRSSGEWKIMLVTILIFCLSSVALFKGTSDTGGVSAHLTLAVTDWFKIRYPQLTLNESSTFIVYSFAILFNICMIVLLLAWFVVNYHPKLKRMVLPFTLILMCFICAVNCKTGYSLLVYRYKNNVSAVEEMQAINDYFAKEAGQDSVVLMVCSNWTTAITRIYDTYFDVGTNYLCHYDVLSRTLSERQETVVETSELDFYEPIGNKSYQLERIDYIIVGDSLGDMGGILEGLEPIPELMGNYYAVYKNTNAHTLVWRQQK